MIKDMTYQVESSLRVVYKSGARETYKGLSYQHGYSNDSSQFQYMTTVGSLEWKNPGGPRTEIPKLCNAGQSMQI